MIVYKTPSRRIFEAINYTFFVLFSLTIILPFVNSISISLSSKKALLAGVVKLFPVEFTLSAYSKLVGNSQFIRTFFNTTFLAVVNTTLVIIISLAAGYALSNKHLILKKFFMGYILVPMYFSGGLIPIYLIINKIGLNNTYGALILPHIVSIFYIIVFRNMIAQLPKEMTESAEIDGAGQPSILFRVIIPLILPTIAAFIVFSAVAYWNEWFNCMIYIQDKKKWTLQYQLREIIIGATMANEKTIAAAATQEEVYSENLKMAALMITILPIIAVYPFVQRYFLAGVLVGAVKG